MEKNPIVGQSQAYVLYFKNGFKFFKDESQTFILIIDFHL